MWKKQILARAIKKKIRVTTLFSEIIELKFEKKMSYILCFLKLS